MNLKNNKIIVIVLVAIVILLAGKQLLSSKDTSQTTTTNTITPTSTMGISTLYKGTSPCADCPGIAVELILQRGNEFDEYGTFTMTETYMERSVDPIKTEGKWTVDRGSAADPDATVYVLNYDKPAQIQYLLKVDAKTMRNLDNDKNELPAPYNYVLTAE